MRIGIMLFDGVEELDAVGPWEVFGMWAEAAPQEAQVVSFAPQAGPVRARKGLTLHADHGFADVGPLDLLLHPGGRGTRPLLKDDGHLAWLRERRADVPLLTSVCTGSLVYAAAGLLTGRPATTHWGALDHLGELDPTIEVRGDDRFVDDGDIVTSSGVSAGIDMALHLVARLAGADRARTVRRGMQYDPAPPV
ncbi:DJ-1/PfpI family protein [Nonomuraea sp. K274]|uniref:DJ-1/PfpI family protein n=1 Tax=Nonomuraea cypriaca TaxID=1187855 RepID=A0A931F6E5_9ACTN|nr:DJ-1/PfpI family protein [Nonomuraea cypriaca]MBF8193148.1 DJ-1/PfpI family protein [Nonomuraea cypriaca]